MKLFCIILTSFILLTSKTYAQSVELNSSNYQQIDEKVVKKDDAYVATIKCKSGDKEFEGVGTSMDLSMARRKAGFDCRAKVAKAIQESGVQTSGSRAPVVSTKVEGSGVPDPAECQPLKDSTKVFNASTPACGRIEFCVMQIVCTDKPEPVKLFCRTNSQGECPDAKACENDQSFIEVIGQMEKGSMKQRKASSAKGE
jgi:hypothetical protein